MSKTTFGVNHPSAVKHWASECFKEALKKTQAMKFMGNSSNALCQVRNEMSKGMGDKVTLHLRAQMAGDGIQGDATLEGNEEALSIYTDSVFIDQLRHATRSAGKMSEQRVPFEVRELGKDGLSDWFAARFDLWFFNQLSGNTAQTDTRYTGNQVCLAPTDVIMEATSTASLSTGDTFNIGLVDKAVERAKTRTYPMRPVRIGSDEYFVAFLHEYQATDLRTNFTTGEWGDIQKAAIQGGQITKNPLFTGALGVWNGTILHTTTRLPTNLTTKGGANTGGRAVVCGAQALGMAFGKDHSTGKPFSWTEELFDFGNQLGIAAGTIAGVKKLQFNSVDHAVVTIPTYAVAHTS